MCESLSQTDILTVTTLLFKTGIPHDPNMTTAGL